MMIFYSKINGEIVGYIEGRVHSDSSLNMWVGDKDNTDRIVVDWKPVKYFDKDGNEVSSSSEEIFTAEFEPDHEQKEIFIELDRKPYKVYKYKVDIKTKNLIPIQV